MSMLVPPWTGHVTVEALLGHSSTVVRSTWISWSARRDGAGEGGAPYACIPCTETGCAPTGGGGKGGGGEGGGGEGGGPGGGEGGGGEGGGPGGCGGPGCGEGGGAGEGEALLSLKTPAAAAAGTPTQATTHAAQHKYRTHFQQLLFFFLFASEPVLPPGWLRLQTPTAAPSTRRS